MPCARDSGSPGQAFPCPAICSPTRRTGRIGSSGIDRIWWSAAEIPTFTPLAPALLIDCESFRGASPAPVGPPFSTETHSGTSGSGLSGPDHTETCVPESSDSSLLPAGPTPRLFSILQLEFPCQPRFDKPDGFRAHLLRHHHKNHRRSAPVWRRPPRQPLRTAKQGVEPVQRTTPRTVGMPNGLRSHSPSECRRVAPRLACLARESAGPIAGTRPRSATC